MRLPTPPWKTAWYDDHLSERFFRELSRAEQNGAPKTETAAQWMEQMVIELGQLAQNMIQLEASEPQTAQIRLAFEKALKLAVMVVRLTAALEQADPGNRHTPWHLPREASPLPKGIAAPPPARPPPVPAPVSAAAPSPVSKVAPGNSAAPAEAAPLPPMREMILSLSRKGLSVAEIEVVTGRLGAEIEKTLGRG